jgi:hypothetical protein
MVRGRNQTCFRRVTNAWLMVNSLFIEQSKPGALHLCACPFSRLITQVAKPGGLERSAFFGNRDHQPLAFCERASAFQDFKANGLVKFSIGESAMCHYDVGPLVDLIDNNIFYQGRRHACRFFISKLTARKPECFQMKKKRIEGRWQTPAWQRMR